MVTAASVQNFLCTHFPSEAHGDAWAARIRQSGPLDKSDMVKVYEFVISHNFFCQDFERLNKTPEFQMLLIEAVLCDDSTVAKVRKYLEDFEINVFPPLTTKEDQNAFLVNATMKKVEDSAHSSFRNIIFKNLESQMEKVQIRETLAGIVFFVPVLDPSAMAQVEYLQGNYANSHIILEVAQVDPAHLEPLSICLRNTNCAEIMMSVENFSQPQLVELGKILKRCSQIKHGTINGAKFQVLNLFRLDKELKMLTLNLLHRIIGNSKASEICEKYLPMAENNYIKILKKLLHVVDSDLLAEYPDAISTYTQIRMKIPGDKFKIVFGESATAEIDSTVAGARSFYFKKHIDNCKKDNIEPKYLVDDENSTHIYRAYLEFLVNGYYSIKDMVTAKALYIMGVKTGVRTLENFCFSYIQDIIETSCDFKLMHSIWNWAHNLKIYRRIDTRKFAIFFNRKHLYPLQTIKCTLYWSINKKGQFDFEFVNPVESMLLLIKDLERGWVNSVTKE